MADVARAVDNQMAISFALTSRMLSYSNKSNNNFFSVTFFFQFSSNLSPVARKSSSHLKPKKKVSCHLNAENETKRCGSLQTM